MQISLRGIYDEVTIPDEWLLERLRIQRDKLLVESDWTQVADAPVDKQAWAEYRQALRDFPNTWVPSENVEFPLSPLKTE
jgi:hypothetical protein